MNCWLTLISMRMHYRFMFLFVTSLCKTHEFLYPTTVICPSHGIKLIDFGDPFQISELNAQVNDLRGKL